MLFRELEQDHAARAWHTNITGHRRVRCVLFISKTLNISKDEALDIEYNMFSYLGSKKFELYMEHTKALLAVLKENNNFLTQLSIATLCRTPLSTLCADSEQASIDMQQTFLAKAERQLLSEHSTAAMQLAKGSLRCSACGSVKISLNQRQARSADEGMDTFCTCTDCQKRWRL